MATIHILCARQPPDLIPLTVRLQRHEFAERQIWAVPDFITWIENDLPLLQTGRLNSDLTPQEQFFDILRKWVTGREMRYGRMFKDLMPANDQVWEMKTADLRLFGWLYRPRQFIVVTPGYADDFKGRNPRRSYADAKRTVLQRRNAMDLDEPKFEGGNYHDLV